MQQDASNARQLIVERVRQSTNILIAVSANPSVDALSAALGLALMLNKLDKHATAVFSGQMPPAMEFLGPDKTFEPNVDSLRDFIISLDKEKADRLRYKVENDVVRIFITPYRTTITEKDLQFSQGDFNVDMIIALGVEKREDLDKAIVAHGRILHDATVMTVNANNQQSSLGTVDWHDPNASSLCEMLVSMSESLQQPGLLDAQIATALLTGIVAATDRFSNQRTSPRVMTMSAQLMAAGANQQLIANNLVKARQQPSPPTASASGEGELKADGSSVKVEAPPPPPKEDGQLNIQHDKQGGKPAKGQPNAKNGGLGAKKQAKKQQNTAEDALAAALPPAANAAPAAGLEQLKREMASPPSQPSEPPSEESAPSLTTEPKAPGSESVNAAEAGETAADQKNSYIVSRGSWRGKRLEPPALGGTLNATTEQAMDESRKAQENDRNKKLLTHPEGASPPPKKSPKQEPQEPQSPPELQNPPQPPPPASPPPTPPTPPAPAPEPPAPVPQTPPPPPPEEPPAPPRENPQPADSDLDAARQAVNEALSSQPFNPAGQPLQSVGAMPLGTNGGQEGAQAQPPAAETTDAQPPQQPQGMTALPPMPPLPQQEPGPDAAIPQPPPPAPDNLPPLPVDTPPAPVTPPTPPPEAPPPTQPQTPPDPGQFKIPGA